MDTGKRQHHSLGSVEALPVAHDRVSPNLGQPLLRAQQRVPQGVVLEGGRVHELRQDELGLAPDLGDFVPRRLDLLGDLVLGHARVANRLGQERHRLGHGVVERGGLVHHGLAGRRALDVAPQVLYPLEHRVGRVGGRGLEREPVHDVRHAAQGGRLEARPGFYVDAHAGKRPWKRFRRYAQAVGQSGDAVEIGGFLDKRG